MTIVMLPRLSSIDNDLGDLLLLMKDHLNISGIKCSFDSSPNNRLSIDPLSPKHRSLDPVPRARIEHTIERLEVFEQEQMPDSSSIDVHQNPQTSDVIKGGPIQKEDDEKDDVSELFLLNL